MSTNRLYIRCKQCGGVIKIANSSYQRIGFCCTEEDLQNRLTEFFDKHSDCAIMRDTTPHEMFEIVDEYFDGV